MSIFMRHVGLQSSFPEISLLDFDIGKRAMRKKVSKPEMQDRPWRNGSLATLMGGM